MRLVTNDSTKKMGKDKLYRRSNTENYEAEDDNPYIVEWDLKKDSHSL